MKVSWDVEELVALIDIYRKSEGKANTEIENDLFKLSQKLKYRAKILGTVHDEKFRNMNGMKMMFQNVVYIATLGQDGLSSASTTMRKVFGMLESSPDVFELILNEFDRRYARAGRQ